MPTLSVVSTLSPAALFRIPGASHGTVMHGCGAPPGPRKGQLPMEERIRGAQNEVAVDFGPRIRRGGAHAAAMGADQGRGGWGIPWFVSCLENFDLTWMFCRHEPALFPSLRVQVAVKKRPPEDRSPVRQDLLAGAGFDLRLSEPT
jgi:hypothetical protein